MTTWSLAYNRTNEKNQSRKETYVIRNQLANGQNDKLRVSFYVQSCTTAIGLHSYTVVITFACCTKRENMKRLINFYWHTSQYDAGHLWYACVHTCVFLMKLWSGRRAMPENGGCTVGTRRTHIKIFFMETCFMFVEDYLSFSLLSAVEINYIRIRTEGRFNYCYYPYYGFPATRNKQKWNVQFCLFWNFVWIARKIKRNNLQYFSIIRVYTRYIL